MPSKTSKQRTGQAAGVQRRVPALPGSTSNCHMCSICLHPIIEATSDEEGQEAILCEGSCNNWYHRWCAGVSTQRYEALSSSEEPFHCPSCAAAEQQQIISELQTSVSSLLEEVRNLRTTVNVLQEKNTEANNCDLLEEVCNLKSIVATLKESSVESHAASELPSDAQTWSEVVRRKSRPSGKKGEMGRQAKGGSEQVGRTCYTQGASKQNTQGRGRGPLNKTRSSHHYVPLPGKRKVWGTRKVSSSNTVKSTITELIGAQVAIEVKRKFKSANGNKTVRWWHVLSGDEETMVLIEKEWGKVKAQTSWNIQPCLSYSSSQAPENSSLESNITPSQPPLVTHNTTSTSASPPSLHQQDQPASGFNQLDNGTMRSAQNSNSSNNTTEVDNGRTDGEHVFLGQ